ncbi:MAG: glutathione S-transferase family protein [Pseudomonadota bacterium]|nr:glutathione S-transferase family protein [Pseudomonadota bacterium]
MSDMYRLHYAPDNASVIIRLVLLELDVPFEDVLLDRSKGEQSLPPYLEINPAGLIPALETDQGILFETGAILLWLTERHGALAPSMDSAERTGFLKWLFYVSNTFHPSLRMHFYPGKYIAEGHEIALRDGCRANLTRSLTLLNEAAGQGHIWLNGDDPSVLDFYLAACLRWAALYTNGGTPWFSLSDWPNLFELCTKLEKRNSIQKASWIEGYSENPFTDPKPITPPVGTAT